MGRSQGFAKRATIPISVVFSGARTWLRFRLATETLATIASDGRTVFLSCRGVEIAHRIVDATFPPYLQVIPARGSMARHSTCDRTTLIDALKAVSTAASERTGGVKLTFRADAIDVHAEDPEEGSADETVSASRVMGVAKKGEKAGDFRVGVNARYLIDACACLSSDRVTIATSGELDPIVVTGEEGSLAVVMPMRI